MRRGPRTTPGGMHKDHDLPEKQTGTYAFCSYGIAIITPAI